MKKYKTLGILVYGGFISLSLFSCGDKEDNITPEVPEKNYFAADINANDEESLLRKEFYKTNGCYLLFNDTLRHDSIGVKPNGETIYQTETVDVPYIMSSQAYFAYKYTYIKDIEKKRAAANFIEKNILPHLSAQLRPYSWLLVNSITKYAINDNSYSYDSEQGSVVGNRATAIGIQDIFDMDESDTQQFAKDLSATIVADKVSSQEASILEPFTKFCDNLYETSSETTPWDDESNLKLMQESGFIGPHYLSGFILYSYYPNKVEDIKDFAKLVVEKDDQYVKDTYNNEIILEKYMVMKKIILSLGYKF
ncbi:hypothetical protein prwr041_18980 [Prevotella herbatica]|uniref:Lipoprotein n=1 Tax=Prevotella herbatica TaxID=2801997 RepID=A0ABN6EJ97_9BACT|nr:hypothetical protein [Prevotella herbatica]BCS86005.1 hypothetical protein prwr041_18980 [Prevotella herbatica]